MAAVIHELWMESDASLLITPGFIQMDVPIMCDKLTGHISEGWNAPLTVRLVVGTPPPTRRARQPSSVAESWPSAV